MNWIPIILLSSIISAMNSTLDKYLLENEEEPATPAFITTFGLAGLPIVLGGLVMTEWMAWSHIGLAILSGLIFLMAVWHYHRILSVREVESSQIQSLLQLTSVQKLFLAAFFLGETLTRPQLIAFWIITLSAIMLVLKPTSHTMRINWSALRIVPVTTLLAINGTMMAYLYRATSVWQGETWYSVGLLLGVLIVWGYAGYHQNYFWQTTSRPMWSILMIGQFTRTLTGLILAWVIASGVPIAVLGAVGSSRFIWVWLLGVFVLHEPFNRTTLIRKGSGILGMMIGTVTLTIFN